MRSTVFWILSALLLGCSPSSPAQPSPAPVTSPLPTTTEGMLVNETITATAEGEATFSAQSLPEAAGYRWVSVADGFSRPLDLQNAGDGRLFVVEQPGRIWIVENNTRRPDPFLDVQALVNDNDNEQGLLGLAFSPDFQDSGLFFVNYTDEAGDSVVARFSVDDDPNRADSDSRREILRIEQPYTNHNGGGIAFGPDGYLYIATGDGGSRDDPLGNGQRLDTLLGKILRIDVATTDPYAIPADNPFLDNARPEIWAYGLRNPWRFAFDRLRGDLYIADVGQNTWEEIDFWQTQSPSGVNYGWNIREGMHAFTGQEVPGLTDPIAEYDHSQGCSVTGGVVVRDPALPAWQGVYLYGDYCTGTIWGLLLNREGVWLNGVLFHETVFTISAFGEAANGAVYLVDHKGAIFRLERASQG